jgi:Trypsin-like peptidase domain/Tetratricopeptide repeat
MKYPLILGCTVALVFSANTAMAKTSTEIEQIARAASVSIQLQNQDVDTITSGVLIHRQGNVYTIATTKHAVCADAGSTCTAVPPNNIYSIGMIDGQKHQISGKDVKLLDGGLDLVIIQFRSSRQYTVAKVAALGSLKIDDVVYTSGIAVKSDSTTDTNSFTFNRGEVLAAVNQRLKSDKGGYTIIYNASTAPGMAGGGVYNTAGQLVAIHGIGDRYQSGTEPDDQSKVGKKIGYNRGISVSWLAQNLDKMGIKVRPTAEVQKLMSVKGITADEHFMTGLNKWIDPGSDVPGGKAQAIQEFSNAIQLNPKYTVAYFLRAYTYSQIQEFNKSLADYNQAIKLNPNYIGAYLNRGELKNNKLKDQAGAIQDFRQAAKIARQQGKPGYIKYALNRLQELGATE